MIYTNTGIRRDLLLGSSPINTRTRVLIAATRLFIGFLDYLVRVNRVI